MSVVMAVLQSTVVMGTLQLLVGKYLKNQTWFKNELIPVVTFVLSVLGFTLSPAAASAAAFIPVAPLASVFLSSVSQTVMVTGTHSMFKNSLLPALKNVGLFFASLMLEKFGGKVQ